MIPYKNPNLIIGKIEEMFYFVVNPFIKDGLKVINKSQKDVLDFINGKNSLIEISKEISCDEKSIKTLCEMFEEKGIVNFTNGFLEPTWNKDVKNMNLWVHTTNDCNLRCTYCYIHTLGLKDYITEGTIQILCNKIKDTVQRRGLKKVSLRLAGGEPLLKFPLWKRYLVQLKQDLVFFGCTLHVAFLTNLIILNEKIISFLKETKFGIGVSIDGLGEYQDNTRKFPNGSGSSKVVMKNIKTLLENGIRPGLMTVVSNANLDGLEDLTKFVIENRLSFRYSFVQGEELNIEKLVEKLYKCYDLLSKAIDDGYPFSTSHKLCDLKFSEPFFQTCSNGFSGGALYTDGNIYFCQKKFGEDIPTGSIFEEEDLLTILQRKTYYLNVHEDCKTCSLRYICTSGCPLERENGKDPHCEVYKTILPIVFQLKAKEKLIKLKSLYKE